MNCELKHGGGEGAICGKAELRDQVNRMQYKFPILCTSFMLHNEDEDLIIAFTCVYLAFSVCSCCGMYLTVGVKGKGCTFS